MLYSILKEIEKCKKNFFKPCPFLQIAFEKMELFKMHQIIKPTCPIRQLFIKITFAFMKLFDFLVKIFEHLSFDREICVTRYCRDWVLVLGSNAWCESLNQKRNAPKMAILTRKSKIFIKAKVIFMKSCLLGHVGFMIWCILNNFIFSNAICKKVHRWILIFFCLATLVWFLVYKNQ